MNSDLTIRTVCPRDCYDGCGLRVQVRAGRVARVSGDPAHPVSRGSLCGKCMHAYNGAWTDPAARLTRPLRRVGRKGEGRFEAVGWEAALAGIAAALQAVLGQAPASSVLHTHYTGTGSLIAGSFPLRFFHRLGATEVDPDTVCNKAGHVALGLMFGESCAGFDPRTAEAARCILLWGINPSVTAPHVDRHWLRASRAPVVVVDPLRHDTARRAHLHLAPRPGSDAALAFGLLHALARAGATDQGFLDRHVLGWEALAPAIERATPAWTEAQTGVPAADLLEAARLYGEGPSLMWLGQGLQRQRLGASVVRACALLPVATGNFGKPGAGFLYLNGAEGRGIDPEYLTAPHLARSPPPVISHMDLAARLEDRVASRALFSWNNNIAASSPEQGRLRRALAREDLLHVAVELFHTDTVDYADWVLPAASFLEFDDLLLPPFHSLVSAQCRAAAPPGQALPNQEIFRRLARAMGYEEPELHESDEEMLQALVRASGVAPDFASLAGQGSLPWPPEPFVQFPGLRFPTPSGRVEVCSSRWVEAGLPHAPEPVVEPVPEDGSLRLLSPASRWLMNSTFGNEPAIARRLARPRAWMAPAEAQARGLREGQLVRVGNAEGRLRAELALSGDVPPGVLVLAKSSWPRHTLDGVNVNALVSGGKTDAGQSSAVHSARVWVEPAGADQPGPAPERPSAVAARRLST